MSLGHSSICGASDTLLAGSVGAQKLEGVFFHSCSWCTWHHRGASLLCDLCWFFWGGCLYFYLEPSQMLRSVCTCWCSQLQLVAECEQCNHSLPAPGRGRSDDRSLPWAMPQHPDKAQHSCCTSVAWTEQTCRVWEGVWEEHLPQVDSPFLSHHHPAVVLGCSIEDSVFFLLRSFIVWWYLSSGFIPLAEKLVWKAEPANITSVVLQMKCFKYSFPWCWLWI